MNLEVRKLDQKMVVFDTYADLAVDALVELLKNDRDYLIRIAAGRHAWGHYRFGDTLMYEYDDGQLAANRVEELADAIVYTVRKLSLQDGVL